MVTKRHLRKIVDVRDGYEVVDLKGIEIWDGADLCLIRDTLIELIENGAEKIGVDMTAVKYIPSGFFGMLYDWVEKGIGVRLFTPQPNVVQMLWFQKFFEHQESGVFQMLMETPAATEETTASPDWTQASWTAESTQALGQAHVVASGSDSK